MERGALAREQHAPGKQAGTGKPVWTLVFDMGRKQKFTFQGSSGNG